MAQEEPLTVLQAAARLGVTKGWVHRLIRDGRLPAVRHSATVGGYEQTYYEIAAADLERVRGLKKTGRPPKLGQAE